MPASYCSSCGAAVAGRFCAQCGSAVASAGDAPTDEPTAVDLSPLPPPPPAPIPPPPLPPPSLHSAPPPTGPAPVYGTIPPPPQPGAPASTGRTAAILGGVVALVVLIAIGLLLLVRGGNDDLNEASATTTPTPTTSPAPTTTPTLPATSAAPPAVAPAAPAAPGDVFAQPAGLLCRDLEARGYSYAAAVDYWRHWGHTNQMDVDKDGIPCTTVYPVSEVESYWGVSLSQPSDGPIGYPSGLLCRDLSARGASTREALLYYVLEGFPDRMDADGNGIPCESVYPDAASVWETG